MLAFDFHKLSVVFALELSFLAHSLMPVSSCSRRLAGRAVTLYRSHRLFRVEGLTSPTGHEYRTLMSALGWAGAQYAGLVS